MASHTQVLDQADLQRDEAARSFSQRNVERCVAARDELPPGTVILRSDQLPPAGLADRVLAALSASACRAGS